MIYGEVDHIKVWDIRNGTRIDGSESKLCRNSLFYYFEIVVNDCVDKVVTILKTPNGKNITLSSPPNWKTYVYRNVTYTRSLSFQGYIPAIFFNAIGKYSIKSIPDDIDEYSKTLNFEVKNCSRYF